MRRAERTAHMWSDTQATVKAAAQLGLFRQSPEHRFYVGPGSRQYQAEQMVVRLAGFPIA